MEIIMQGSPVCFANRWPGSCWLMIYIMFISGTES